MRNGVRALSFVCAAVSARRPVRDGQCELV